MILLYRMYIKRILYAKIYNMQIHLPDWINIKVKS